MDRKNDLCKLGSKSKSIVRTPAQDRLKSLQRKLQAEQLKPGNQINKSIIQSSTIQTSADIKTRLSPPFSKVNKERMKPPENPFSNNPDIFKRKNAESQEACEKVPFKKSSLTPERSESSIKSALTTMWNSIKNTFDKIKSPSKIQTDLPNAKSLNELQRKRKNEKDVDLYGKKKRKDSDGFKNDILTSETKNNRISADVLRKFATKRKYLKTRIDDKMPEKDYSKNFLEDINEGQKKDLSENEYSTNGPVVPVSYKQVSQTSSCLKSSPVTPVDKKFSVNQRLQNLRNQLVKNQTEMDFKMPNLKSSTPNSATPRPKYTVPEIKLPEPDTSAMEMDFDNEEVFENYNTVNANLSQLYESHSHFATFNENNLYIVPDTNVFLHNLTFLNDLLKLKLCGTEGSILYIPYIVLHELDKLKMKTDNPITVRASRAIKFINENFTAKNPKFQGQNAIQSRNRAINIESADDQIINCCLQLHSHNVKCILLSNDINLRNKAICNRIICSTKDDLEAK